MSEIQFTEDEAALVDAMARERSDRGSRLGFYASVLVPVLGFATYGLIAKDFLAISMALLGLAIFVTWHLSREFDRLDVFLSVFRKVAQHQREQSGNAQQATAGDAGNPRA